LVRQFSTVDCAVNAKQKKRPVKALAFTGRFASPVKLETLAHLLNAGYF
jgi:hypothetical protein